MKILHIRFCNLNSLAGSWSISLDTIDYQADGIFAITGPTGSGKTTVLDAVCLALYGRTPRLKLVTKSSNEIMTRQTGECWAEVEFSTAKGVYRCHWGQHRARKSPDGELQPPRHEIVDVNTDRPLETKMKMVNRKVVEVTGLSYDQFTRSILLAQGDFNTFLKATADERAPILEQITGTDIYSRISKKVHERKSEEHALLAQLTRECDGFMPLPPEVLAEINIQHKKLQDEAAVAAQEIKTLQTSLEWYGDLKKIGNQIDQHSTALTKLNDRWQEANPLRQQLAGAEKARILQPEQQRLMAMRKQQADELQQLEQSRSGHLKLSAEIKKIEAEKTKAEELFTQRKSEQRELQQVLVDVRRLDQQISLLHQQKDELGKEQAGIAQRIKDVHESFTASAAAVTSMESELVELTGYRQRHEQDSRLVEELSGLRRLVDNYTEQSRHHEELSEKSRQVCSLLEKLSRQLPLLVQQREDLARQLKSIEDADAKASEKQRELLAGQTLEELYRIIARQQEEQHKLEDTAARHTQQLKAEQALEELQQREAAFDREKAQIQSSLARAVSEYELRNESVQKQEQIVRLAARIKDYEQERAQLLDGEPCPLCGSRSHPYCNNNKPELSEEDDLLARERNLLQQVNEQKLSLQTRLTAVQTRLEELQTAKSREQQRVQDAAVEVQTSSDKLQIPQSTDLSAELEKRINACKQEVQQLQDKVARVSRLKEELQQNSSRRSNLEAEAKTAATLLQEQQHKQQMQEQLFGQLQAEVERSTASLSETLKDIGRQTQGYIETEPHSDNLTLIMEELAMRRTSWLKSEQREQQLNTSLLTRKNELDKLQSQLEGLKSNADDLTRRMTVSGDRMKQLIQERIDLFGHKDASREEQGMLTQVETAEKALAALTTAVNEKQRRHSGLEERVTSLEKRTRERRKEMGDLHDSLKKGLVIHGFQDEDQLLKASLPPKEFDTLSRSISQLEKEIHECKALKKAAENALMLEQEKAVTEMGETELTARLEEVSNSYNNIMQESGALNQRLSDNERQRKLHQEKLKSITAQQKTLEEWAQLHELIGSSDGKKFRNFAQGLTFDIMIHHANSSLQKMTDRYLLVRDPDQPLELHVIDNYQAGEIRSTKNLSGGETFIVSMALALGLSNMASHNVQVDSLFLDEGFGTLDQEALQTALDTLSSLHQEGKLIGIISHVSALQERITTRIQVQRGPGGIGSLSGPGVARWKPKSK